MAIVVPLSKEQADTLRSTSAELGQNVDENALTFFLTIFELAPEVKQLFPFLRNSEELPSQIPSLQKHATKAFSLVLECVQAMDDVATIAKLQEDVGKLGRKHLAYGVIPAHFPVIRSALLITVKKACADNPEDVEGPRTAAIDILETFFVAGLEKRN
eukprot:TRINITY_DN84_c0_g1_i4.p1 TRINITY_DN84_c0_g1~~TRINITY_DN84_c0_g1_i4.p1  ORF type:complete len:158 (+),score=51.37 TRINITY_DN84_c0_g1_i4:86-559(+)